MAKKVAPNVLIKRTFEEMYERGYNDPVLFVQDFLDRTPHEGQAAWLRRSGKWGGNDFIAKPDAKQSVLVTGNRWGKTDAIAMELLWRAFYQKRPEKYTFDDNGRLRPYRAVNVALSLDQAMIAWNYAYNFAKDSPIFSEFVVDVLNSPFPSIIIGTGGNSADRVISEVWARSTAKGAKFLLGKTFNYLCWDEAAFEPNGRDILDGVIRMRLVDQSGDLALVSAPSGKNWLYEEFLLGVDKVVNGRLTGDPIHYSQQGCTFDNPKIDHKAVRRSMEQMSEEQRAQNIYGQFAESSSIFDTTSVQNCYKDQEYGHLFEDHGLPADVEWALEETDNGVRTHLKRHRDKRLRYCVGIDLARKRDSTCITVLSIPDKPNEPCQVVFFELLNTAWRKQFDRIQAVYDRYHFPPILIDSTAMGGDVILEQLQNEPYSLDVSGYNLAGGQEKTNLILHLQEAIQDGRIKFPYIKELVNCLIYYKWEDKNLFTDPVFSLALAWEKALEMGMGESRGAYDLLVPDVGPICVGRDFSGKASLRGANDCSVCEHPDVELIDEFCRKGFLGETDVTTVERLVAYLSGRNPNTPLSAEEIVRHARSHVETEDEMDGLDGLMNRKYSKLVIL